MAIAEKHEKLVTSLRTAWAKELNLDKKETSYNDLLDGLRLALKGYNIEWKFEVINKRTTIFVPKISRLPLIRTVYIIDPDNHK